MIGGLSYVRRAKFTQQRRSVRARSRPMRTTRRTAFLRQRGRLRGRYSRARSCQQARRRPAKSSGLRH